MPIRKKSGNLPYAPRKCIYLTPPYEQHETKLIFGVREFNLWSSHTKTQKNQKMVLDAALLNTLHYKVCIKGKMEQSKDRSCALPYTSV